MFKLLGFVGQYLKHQDIVTDSMIFRMHNHLTTALLMSFSVIITASQFVGNPISCIVPSALPTQPVNTYCWIASTFIMPDAINREVNIKIIKIMQIKKLINNFINIAMNCFYHMSNKNLQNIFIK